ncbi:MAG: hypothetical protein JW699_05230, partial [Chitinispirillaceae bacterium]|nr:hypothetical protein [Chitinispirillaceae bacterium]
MKLSDFELLSRFVFSYRRKLVIVRIILASLHALIAFFSLLALLQIVFALFPWTVLPAVFDAAFAGVCLFILGHALYAVTFGAPGQLKAAREIERRTPVEGLHLSLALELSGDRRTAGNPFTAEACSRAAAHISRCPRAPQLPRRAALAAAAGGLIGLWCLLNPLGLSPRLLDYWALPFSPSAAGGAVVSPGSTAVPLGASVTLRLNTAAGSFPASRCMVFSLDGERMSNVLLRPDSAGAFAYRIDSVRSSFLYRFAYGRSLSRIDTVTVVPLPRLERLSVRVRPPKYVRKAERTLPEGQGNFEAYEGSIARITIESGRLARAALVRRPPPAAGRGDTVPLAVRGRAASGETTVNASCDYRFIIADTFGQKNDSLPVFRMECVPDEPPSVQIIRPGYSRDLEPEQVETLAVEGVDDIGIRSMYLRWKKPGADIGGRDLSDPAFPPLVRTAFIWHL